MEDKKYKEHVSMSSPNWNVPEFTKPLYNVLTTSKIPLVNEAIKLNFFKSTHFVWLDFDIHLLKDTMLNKSLFSNMLEDKIKLLCISPPKESDKIRHNFYGSHINRFDGSIITGSGENMIK